MNEVEERMRNHVDRLDAEGDMESLKILQLDAWRRLQKNGVVNRLSVCMWV